MIPGKDGRRAGGLLDRGFTAAAPNRTWVMDFTYVRTWAGFVYTAFVLVVFAQRIVAWNSVGTKAVELVDVPVRMALWQRGHEGHHVVRSELIGHADAGPTHLGHVHRSPRRRRHPSLDRVSG
jgi:putative transposase